MRFAGRLARAASARGPERVRRHQRPDPASHRRSARYGAARDAVLREAEELLLADLIVAECVYVLESFYEVERGRVAALMRAAVAMPEMRVLDGGLLLRALEVYEVERLDFAEAYLVASAEATGVGAIVSFDEGIDAVRSVERLVP